MDLYTYTHIIGNHSASKKVRPKSSYISNLLFNYCFSSGCVPKETYGGDVGGIASKTIALLSGK